MTFELRSMRTQAVEKNKLKTTPLMGEALNEIFR